MAAGEAKVWQKIDDWVTPQRRPDNWITRLPINQWFIRLPIRKRIAAGIAIAVGIYAVLQTAAFVVDRATENACDTYARHFPDGIATPGESVNQWQQERDACTFYIGDHPNQGSKYLDLP